MATDAANAFHPVFSVKNIKDFIPLVLDQEKGQYALWVELFHTHACAYDVLDHIDPSVPRPPLVNASTWNRIDAIVKQWIYSTISKDLLQTIIKKGATAQELWTRLEDIFQDNKPPSIDGNKGQMLLENYVDFFQIEGMAPSASSASDRTLRQSLPSNEPPQLVRMSLVGKNFKRYPPAYSMKQDKN